MNKEIELLNKKLEAQDKIINTQVLEIAKLNKDLKDACYVIEKIKKEKQQVIEYINKRMVHEGEYYFRKAKHFRNTEFGKDLLVILGEKENE